MTARSVHPRVVVAASGVLAIHAAAIIAAHQGWAAQPAIAAGLTLDLTVTAALLVYALAVRPRHLPLVALFPVLAAGAAMARWQLPATPITGAFAVAWAGLEAVLVVTSVRRVLAIGRGTRAGRGRGLSLLDATEASLTTSGLPRRLAAIIATEVVIVTSVVTGWRAPAGGPGHHTVHIEKGWSLFAGVLVALTVVETAAVHIALAPHAPVAAWIVTGLSAYSALWLIGDALALRHGGVRISDDGIDIALGVRWRCHLPWSQLARVDRADGGDHRGDGWVRMTVLEATVVLDLVSPLAVRGPFGMTRHARHIALTVDRADELVTAAQTAHRSATAG